MKKKVCQKEGESKLCSDFRLLLYSFQHKIIIKNISAVSANTGLHHSQAPFTQLWAMKAPPFIRKTLWHGWHGSIDRQAQGLLFCLPTEMHEYYIFCRYYIIAIIGIPVFFYAPKFFELRTTDVSTIEQVTRVKKRIKRNKSFFFSD